MTEWISIAGRGDVVSRALKVAAVVGTILVAINQGDVILAGAIDAGVIAKILLTYLVPYGVSTYAAVEAIRAQARSDG